MGNDIVLHVVDEPVSKVLLPTAKPGQYRHGFSQTPTYTAWHRTLGRCRNPKHPQYHKYGGRGASVCFRWLKFDAFVADMGAAPEGASLVRIDETGDFEPGNCTWGVREKD